MMIWWRGAEHVNNNTDVSTAEFIGHVRPPAALQAPPLAWMFPSCSCWCDRVGPDNLLLLLHRRITDYRDSVGSWWWSVSVPADGPPLFVWKLLLLQTPSGLTWPFPHSCRNVELRLFSFTKCFFPPNNHLRHLINLLGAALSALGWVLTPLPLAAALKLCLWVLVYGHRCR